MVCRRVAALLLALVLAGFGAGEAIAAVPPLSSTPPTTLGGPPPGLTKPKPKHHHSRPRPTGTSTSPAPVPPTSTTTRRTTGSLPMTGADLPLEFGIAAGLVAIGMVVRVAGRSRRYRCRRF